MDLEAERKLKFDRRLRERWGWISDAELEAELASLPDAADKMYVEAPRATVDSSKSTQPSGDR